MKKDELERLTGFTTFFECFKWLKKSGLDKKFSIKCVKEASEKIVFGKPIKVPAEEKNILISDIKSEVLDEIYSRLPTVEDIVKIQQSIAHYLPGYQIDELNQIINKIPTK